MEGGEGGGAQANGTSNSSELGLDEVWMGSECSLDLSVTSDWLECFSIYRLQCWVD